jgi:hypothetical protein
VVTYGAKRQQRRMSLNGILTLSEARKEAKALLGEVARGGDPLDARRWTATAASNTLRAIAEDYLKREAVKLRTSGERTRVLEKLIYPTFGDRQIDAIKRSEIVKLLDRVEEENPHRAQAVLAILSKLFNRHASRHHEFLTPIRRGMARIKPQEQARDRVLSDDEIRAVGKAAETFPGPYGYRVRFRPLTATRALGGRRNDVARASRRRPGRSRCSHEG